MESHRNVVLDIRSVLSSLSAVPLYISNDPTVQAYFDREICQSAFHQQNVYSSACLVLSVMTF